MSDWKVINVRSGFVRKGYLQDDSASVGVIRKRGEPYALRFRFGAGLAAMMGWKVGDRIAPVQSPNGRAIGFTTHNDGWKLYYNNGGKGSLVRQDGKDIGLICIVTAREDVRALFVEDNKRRVFTPTKEKDVLVLGQSFGPMHNAIKT